MLDLLRLSFIYGVFGMVAVGGAVALVAERFGYDLGRKG